MTERPTVFDALKMLAGPGNEPTHEQIELTLGSAIKALELLVVERALRSSDLRLQIDALRILQRQPEPCELAQPAPDRLN